MSRLFAFLSLLSLPLATVCAGAPANPKDFSVVAVMGPWTERYDLPGAFAAAGISKVVYHQVEVTKPNGSDDPLNEAKLQTPLDFAVLDKAKLLVVANVPATAFSQKELEGVAAWTEKGGCVVFLGGLYTFGKGGFAGTPFERIIPVAGMSPWEVEELSGTNPFVSTGFGAALLAGSADTVPTTLFAHELYLKPKATALVTCDDQTMVAGWDVGAGKVLAYLAAPIGDGDFTENSGGFWRWISFGDSRERILFWQWRYWPDFLGAMLLWGVKA